MWIEIRCDSRTLASAKGKAGNRCYSHDNEGPMAESSDTQRSILGAVRELGDEAKATGWIKRKGEWVCPFCANQPATDEQGAEL